MSMLLLAVVLGVWAESGEVEIADLDSGQRASLSTWITDRYTVLLASEITQFGCRRAVVDGVTGAYCVVSASPDLTSAEYQSLLDAGHKLTRPRPDDIAEGGTSAVVRVVYKPIFFSGSDVTSLASIANSIFGISAGSMYQIYFEKKWAIDDDTGVYEYVYPGSANERTEYTIAQYLACLKAETCGAIVN